MMHNSEMPKTLFEESLSSAINQIKATLLAMKHNLRYAKMEADMMYGDLKEWTKQQIYFYSDRSVCMKPVDYQRIGHILFEIYVWNAWNLLAVGAMQIVGHTSFASDIMSLLISKFTAFGLALFIIPIAFYLVIKMELHPTLQQGRFQLLMLCIPIGLLSGYSMADYTLAMYIPPAFVMPLFMGVVSSTIAQSAPNRLAHILLVVGAGAAISLSVAIALQKVNKLFIVCFLINIIVYTGDLQIKIGAAQLAEELEPLKSLLVSVIAALIIDYIITYCTPLDKEILSVNGDVKKK